VATLSNGNIALLTNMAKHSNIPWDCILSAELSKHYKPDPEVYITATELLALTPEKIMMVAAHSHDLNGAKAIGMRTAFVHRPLEFGIDQIVDVPPQNQFDLSVSNFIELAEALVY
jgi:2-haloacid dehalogenase